MENDIIVGYKVFGYYWKCLDKQYSCPGKFYEDVEPVIGKIGMHFCTDIHDLFKYYHFNVPNDFESREVFHVAKVFPLSDAMIIQSKTDSLCCTNKMLVKYELDYNDLDRLINPQTFLERAAIAKKSSWDTFNHMSEYWLSLYKYFELGRCSDPFSKWWVRNYKLL